MPAPRREAATGPTPASAYVLERKLLRAYEALYQQQIASIWHPATRLAAQVAVLGGLERAATRKGYAESRLREAMPDVIRRLKPDDQPALAALLLDGEADLSEVVAHLLKAERWLNYHQDDPRLKVNDDALCRAAGIGHIARADPGSFQRKPVRLPLGPPLELTPGRRSLPRSCARPSATLPAGQCLCYGGSSASGRPWGCFRGA